ncbi:TlyA family RNA methyltransferase [Aeromicrobium sp. CF3.5]|uniref:TlyA family RNA methyltransferase n=1 Tax=Aeromicrobium sp. CF3.5 TaxID=3373078 RepID=UPI003EE73C0B
MTRRLRLDAELVRRGLARSRDHAATLIDDGLVRVAGTRASKAATGVTTDQAIVVKESHEPSWASRGAHKLLGALEVFEPQGLQVAGRRCLDAGASTGGFTDVLLSRGAAQVVAVDVGYGQLVWSLASDDRVHVVDRTNVRHLTPDDIDGTVSLVVSDLSFISLTVVMGALTSLCEPSSTEGTQMLGGDIVLMVKPQFEVGRERLGKNGVVRDPSLHAEAVHGVCESAQTFGWGTRALAPSPLPGPAGNVEYFCWLRTDAPAPDPSAADAVVAAGPLTADSPTNREPA